MLRKDGGADVLYAEDATRCSKSVAELMSCEASHRNPKETPKNLKQTLIETPKKKNIERNPKDTLGETLRKP